MDKTEVIQRDAGDMADYLLDDKVIPIEEDTDLLMEGLCNGIS